MVFLVGGYGRIPQGSSLNRLEKLSVAGRWATRRTLRFPATRRRPAAGRSSDASGEFVGV